QAREGFFLHNDGRAAGTRGTGHSRWIRHAGGGTARGSGMSRGFYILVGVLATLIVVPVTVLSGATAATNPWEPPRTLDGQPDLQGVWSFATVTPLQRPSSLADKEVLGEEEAATFAAAQIRRQNRDLIDPKKGGANYPPESKGGVVPYNEFWYDR